MEGKMASVFSFLLAGLMLISASGANSDCRWEQKEQNLEQETQMRGNGSLRIGFVGYAQDGHGHNMSLNLQDVVTFKELVNFGARLHFDCANGTIVFGQQSDRLGPRDTWEVLAFYFKLKVGDGFFWCMTGEPLKQDLVMLPGGTLKREVLELPCLDDYERAGSRGKIYMKGFRLQWEDDQPESTTNYMA